MNVVDKEDGWTPLHYAVSCDNLQVVKTLTRKRNCNIWQQDYNGRTPLYIASNQGRLDITKHLIRSYIKKDNRRFSYFTTYPLDISCNKGLTPLHAAVISGNTSIVKLLLDYGCDPHLKTIKGHNALDFAIMDSSHSIIDLLKMEYEEIQKNK